MTDQTWERRPGPARHKYKDLVEHLKQHPGEWVKVRTAPTVDAAGAAAYQIKIGRRADFRPAGEFEAYTEGLDVIARYVGTGAEDCPECHGHVKPGLYCPTCGLANNGETA